MAADNDDPKVKDMLDAATRAELEHWFGLPSFEQVADGAAPASTEDPDIVEIRERRERAIAAVDPALLEAHRRRTEPPDDLLRFQASLEPRVDPDVALFDFAMADRQLTIAEPREVEIPEQLRDDLKDCTPQALLRDLHRPELDFEKTFEVIDIAVEQRLDIVAEVATAMATRWQLPALEGSPFRQAREIMQQLRIERRRSWPEWFAEQPLPNRRWEQDR